MISGLCLFVNADVVYIGVIHPYHLSTCLLFTNAKKNVLCEKPLAMNTKEVKEILSSAKRNDVFLMEVRMESVHTNTCIQFAIALVRLLRWPLGANAFHVTSPLEAWSTSGMFSGFVCFSFHYLQVFPAYVCVFGRCSAFAPDGHRSLLHFSHAKSNLTLKLSNVSQLLNKIAQS